MILKHARYLGPDYMLHTHDFRIEGSVITEIDDTLVALDSEEVIDCSSYLIYPTLADCHVHTPDTLLRGLFSDMRLHDWCNDTQQGKLQQELYDYIDHSVTTSEFRIMVLYAYLQYVKMGVGFIVETGQADLSCQALEDCIKEIGIRALVDWYDETPVSPIDCTRISRGTHLEEEESLEADELNRTVTRVNQQNVPLMTHCLETEFRRDESLRKFGKSTVKLLDYYNLLNEQAILFHCVETDDEDIKLLASRKACIVHCPVSNQVSGAHKMHLKALLEKKAHITLGTDYLTHDIWEVMRTTYAELKQTNLRDTHGAKDVWHMATKAAATIGEQSGYSGSIDVGGKADLLFIKDNLSLGPLVQLPTFSNVAFNTLTYTRPSMIEHVMIDGNWVVKSKVCTTIDEELIEKQYEAIARKVFHGRLL